MALGGVLARGETRDAVGFEVWRLLELGCHLRSESEDGAIGTEVDAVVDGGVSPRLAAALGVGVDVGCELCLGLLLRPEGNFAVAVVVAVVEVGARVEARVAAVPVGAIFNVLLDPFDVAVEGEEGVVRGGRR